MHGVKIRNSLLVSYGKNVDNKHETVCDEVKKFNTVQIYYDLSN